MRKIGIYGGTFSPPHLGHVRAAELFIQERSLSELHILPAGVPPHKAEGVSVSSGDRLQMCNLAFSHLPSVQILDCEIRRSGKSYTVLTLREYAEKGIHPELLLGTDMLLSFEKWYCFEEVFSLCTLVCIPREADGRQNELLFAEADRLRRTYGADIAFLNGVAVEISSSELRAAIAAHEESALLPPTVADYIRERGLYLHV